MAENNCEQAVCDSFQTFLDGKDLCCIVTARKSLRFVSLLKEAQRLDALEADAREEVETLREFLGEAG